MSRTFWVAVGAVGGIAAYRRGERMARRARELGPLGTAQAVAASTSRLAGHTASGLGRINEVKARREGRLVIGSAEEVIAPAVVPELAEAVPAEVEPPRVADLRTAPGSRRRTGDPERAPTQPAAPVTLVSVR